MIKLRKIISVILTLCIIPVCLSLASCSKENKMISSQLAIEYFKSNIIDILVGEPTEVTFTAKIVSDNSVKKLSVVSSNDSVVVYLYDNGKNGDEKSDDNIYTGIAPLLSNEMKHQDYFASFEENKSKAVSIFFYTELTEDDYKECLVQDENIMMIESKYIGEDGYVIDEKHDILMEEIYDYVKEQTELGIVKSSSKCAESIYMKLSSGIGYLYSPLQKNVLSSGNEFNIITLEPADEKDYKKGVKKAQEFLAGNDFDLEDCGSVVKDAQLVDNLEGYAFDQNTDKLSNQSVTIDSLKKISDFQVILWLGHGGYNEDTIGSALVTSEKGTWEKSKGKYSADLQDDRLVVCRGLANRFVNFITIGTDYDYFDCVYAVTSKFFNTYLGNMDNAFVYLGACYSAKDKALTQSFRDKGAKVVFAYTDSVACEYEIEMRKILFNSLVYSESNGPTWTAQQALDNAQRVCGKTNTYYIYLKEHTSELVLVGEGNYRFINGELNEITTQAADKDTLLSLLKVKTADEIVEFVYDDFDDNGTCEAFGITATGKWEPEGNRYNGVQVWYIDTNGATMIKSGMYDPGYLNPLIVINNRKFICWLEGAANYGTIAQIFGVNNGQPFISSLSGKYSGVSNQSGKNIAFTYHHDFGGLGTYDYELGLSETNDLYVVGQVFNTATSDIPQTVTLNEKDAEFVQNLFSHFSYTQVYDSQKTTQEIVGRLMYENVLGDLDWAYQHFFGTSGTEQFYNGSGEKDPLNKFSEYDGYEKCLSEKVDWIVNSIFNTTPVNSYAYNGHANFYKNNIYYYSPIGATGEMLPECKIKNIKMLENGDCEISVDLFEWETNIYQGSMLGIFRPKTIDGVRYLSVIKTSLLS